MFERRSLSLFIIFTLCFLIVFFQLNFVRKLFDNLFERTRSMNILLFSFSNDRKTKETMGSSETKRKKAEEAMESYEKRRHKANSSMSSTSVAMMPSAEEIEEFFSATKRQEQKRFAEKVVSPNFSAQIEAAGINTITIESRHNGNQNIFGIIGIADSVLLAALQVKYQSTTSSPFHDHPIAMAIAIASFLIFCLGYDMEQIHFRTTGRASTFGTLLHHLVRMTGFISLASLTLTIFSTSTSSTILSLIVYLIFPFFFVARLMLHFMQNTDLCENRDGLPVYLRGSANGL